VSLRSLQNALCDSARVSIKVGVRVGVRFMSEIYNVHLHSFESVQHILQIAQIDNCVQQ